MCGDTINCDCDGTESGPDFFAPAIETHIDCPVDFNWEVFRAIGGRTKTIRGAEGDRSKVGVSAGRHPLHGTIASTPMFI
jgi:hypothetical protein